MENLDFFEIILLEDRKLKRRRHKTPCNWSRGLREKGECPKLRQAQLNRLFGSEFCHRLKIFPRMIQQWVEESYSTSCGEEKEERNRIGDK